MPNATTTWVRIRYEVNGNGPALVAQHGLPIPVSSCSRR
jgi:hypothetical protein